MQFVHGSSGTGGKDTQFGYTESGTFQIQVKLNKGEFIQVGTVCVRACGGMREGAAACFCVCVCVCVVLGVCVSVWCVGFAVCEAADSFRVRVRI